MDERQVSMTTSAPRRRGRVAGAFAFSALLLALGGCHQSATPTPMRMAEAAATADVAAPVTTPQGQSPTPATFDVAALAERVTPMVVNITVKEKVTLTSSIDPFDFFHGGRGGEGPDREMTRVGVGTGFIIDPDGYVITNEHVVHDADELSVRLSNEREYPAEVVGRDRKLDLALIKLKGAANLPAVQLGSSDSLRVGESVLAVGNPYGLGHTVTLGIVSAKARSIGAGPYDDFIQTDASINPGNSGGPLFNWKGEVVGINAAIRAGANGIGFAIPVSSLRDILPQLRDRGFVERGKLGLVFQPVSDDLAKALTKALADHAAAASPGKARREAALALGTLLARLAVADVDLRRELDDQALADEIDPYARATSLSARAALAALSQERAEALNDGAAADEARTEVGCLWLAANQPSWRTIQEAVEPLVPKEAFACPDEDPFSSPRAPGVSGAPEVGSAGLEYVVLGGPWSFDVPNLPSEPDTEAALVGPEGMTLSATGHIDWTPPRLGPFRLVTLRSGDSGVTAVVRDLMVVEKLPPGASQDMSGLPECGCRAAGEPGRSEGAALVALGLALAAARRRTRSRPSRRPE